MLNIRRLDFPKVLWYGKSELKRTMAGSSPSTPALSADQHTTPEYRNWLALGHALTTVLCQGLRPFINREMKAFYANVTATLAPPGPCTCVFVAGRRPNQYHDMSSCTWANVLQRHHHKGRPNWKQSDCTKWTDPIQGPWEIAKLFLPDLGAHVIVSAEDMDVTGILNLMDWCDHFRPIPQASIKDIRDIRNQKWAHVPKMELTEADKANAFASIENLLQDPYLAHDPNVKKALREMQTLKCASYLSNFEAHVLKEYKERGNVRLRRELEKESKRNQKLRSQLESRLRKMQKSLENVNNKIRALSCLANLVKVGPLFLCNGLIKNIRAFSKLPLGFCLKISLLCIFCVTLLDPSSYKDGE